MSEEKKPKTKKETRKRRKFPTSPIDEVLEFAKSVYKFGAGNKVRRLSLFDEIGKSPDSGPTRTLITNSGKYGLTKGSYGAEFLELTPKGKQAVNDDIDELTRRKAQIQLAITDHPVYLNLYETYVGNKIPSRQVMIDFVKEYVEDCPESEATKIVNTFIVNAQHLGVLQTIAGAERLVKVDHALEDLSDEPATSNHQLNGSSNSSFADIKDFAESNGAIEDVCFYITPIGEDDSEQRKHADLFLGSLIEPALESLKLKVIRADKIAKPGTITKQIIEYIFRAKLVIADLSYHNPNVFYELALRHAARLPTVQIIRKSDKIPFDLSHYRTITIDTTDIYTLVPKLETYKSEISTQVEEVLKDPDIVDNPVINVFPNLKLKI